MIWRHGKDLCGMWHPGLDTQNPCVMFTESHRISNSHDALIHRDTRTVQRVCPNGLGGLKPHQYVPVYCRKAGEASNRVPVQIRTPWRGFTRFWGKS